MIASWLLLLLMFGLAVTFAVVVNGWREIVARELLRRATDVAGSAMSTSVAVIVPARDAGDTIIPLLQDLYAQSHDRQHMLVIVVDDDSSDDTADKVRGMMARWPQLQLIPSQGGGKKAAIGTGVRAARAELILLTDADVRCGPERVRLIAEHVQRSSSDLVIMPVATDGQGLLGGLQENEQAALMMCAAAEALQGRPLLANGANLAFRRSAFLDVNGYEGDPYASGDDIFLVRRMRVAGKRVSYLLHPDVLVRVEAEPTWRGFVRQRLRWAGKMRGVPWRLKWMPALGLLFPWFLLAATLAIDWPAMVGSRFLMGGLLMIGSWLVWATAVPPLVRDGERFMGQRSTLLGAGASYLAFVIYAPLIAVSAFMVRPKWKGRRV